MMFKPFKPPTALTKANGAADGGREEPPFKKARLNNIEPTENAVVESHPKLPNLGSPLSVRSNNVSNASSGSGGSQSSDQAVYYSVLWRKFTTKKNKTWDGDGIIRVSNGRARLEDSSGKDMGQTACSGPLLPESMLSIGGKEIQVDGVLSREEFLTQRKEPERPSAFKEAKSALGAQRTLQLSKSSAARASSQSTISSRQKKTKAASKDPLSDDSDKAQARKSRLEAPQGMATQARYRNPMLETTIMPKQAGPKSTPRHDPDAEGSLVMERPRARDVPKGRQVVDVVVDPLLSKHLRDHQREGVKFLYECMMGMKASGDGAILADEMGLGKTLQTIALIWTLLKQNPIFEEPPVIKKALIVCPATLINNWKKEFRKWLGNERIGVFVFDDGRKRITDFTRGRSYSVLIIGYEKLRTNIDELQKGPGIDIVVADEGHRLKTQQNKAGTALRSLETTKRIILSGTPIQNDLTEFFSMVDFVNPGALGTAKAFIKQFENPIERSRQPKASTGDVEKGTAMSDELAETVAPFILRRTVDVLSKYLPPKTEYVLLCRPTRGQATVYRKVLESSSFQASLNGSNGPPSLQLIMALRKVCNSPQLLRSEVSQDSEDPSFMADVASELSPRLLNANSTKIRVLDQLLHILRQNTDEKIVLASQFTSTLDVIGNLLTSLSLPFLRLDGSVQPKQRQDLVDTFNRTPASAYFAFLISAKAGGAGINLIGASRLVLFDVDWNPATDAQVLARIHRDGQRRHCFVYRFLMAGALDEKIWQRQVTKLGLADSLMERKASTNSFTKDELRDLFQLDEKSICQTHELIGCTCAGKGLPDTGPNTKTPGTPKPDQDAEDIGFDGNDKELPDHCDEEALEDPLLPMLKPANEVDMETQEQEIIQGRRDKQNKKQGAGMQSLMNYTHIDTSQIATEQDTDDVEALIHDDVLLNVLKDEGNMVQFVFARTADLSQVSCLEH